MTVLKCGDKVCHVTVCFLTEIQLQQGQSITGIVKVSPGSMFLTKEITAGCCTVSVPLQSSE